MRGAGTADHTADSTQGRGEKHVSDKEDAFERMTTCALNKAPLPFGQPGSIVACPYGRLYNKEAAVEALLRRKQHQEDDNNNSSDELGAHIRGLKDLHSARFSLLEKPDGSYMPSCPVTGQEFNGQQPAILLVPGNPDTPNVVSQRAFKQLGEENLQVEYGPFRDQVRLAPTALELENIMEELERKRQSKKTSKKDRKRKDRVDRAIKKEKKAKSSSSSPPPLGEGAVELAAA